MFAVKKIEERKKRRTRKGKKRKGEKLPLSVAFIKKEFDPFVLYIHTHTLSKGYYNAHVAYIERVIIIFRPLLYTSPFYKKNTAQAFRSLLCPKVATLQVKILYWR